MSCSNAASPVDGRRRRPVRAQAMSYSDTPPVCTNPSEAKEARMKKFLLCLLVVLLLHPLATLNAQDTSPQPSPADKLNPQIEKIVREISAANIEATIRKLVSFGTRHSLSETESETR